MISKNSQAKTTDNMENENENQNRRIFKWVIRAAEFIQTDGDLEYSKMWDDDDELNEMMLGKLAEYHLFSKVWEMNKRDKLLIKTEDYDDDDERHYMYKDEIKDYPCCKIS